MNNMLSNSQIQVLMDLIELENVTFDELVRVSQLDKTTDFRFGDFSGLDLRGVDLSGFDFTGSDLRGCLIDAATVISSTTILVNADVDWIIVEKTPIHVKMLEVEHTSTSRDRRNKLDELVSNYSSSAHIHQFLKMMIENTRSIDVLFDLLDYFHAKTKEDELLVLGKLVEVSLDSVRLKKRRSPHKYSHRFHSQILLTD